MLTSAIRTLAVIVVTLAAAPRWSRAAEAHPYAWRLEQQGGGCRTWVSPVAGRRYVAARAECVVPASREVIAAVLRDIPGFPAWMHDCKETKLLRVVDPGRDDYVFWFRQHVPLLTDRDMVLESQAERTAERTRVLAMSTSAATYDAGEGYVRMPSFTSEWLIEPLGPDETKVTFTIDPDPGDGLPTGITNRLITKTPRASIEGLMRVVKLSKYAASAPPAAR